MKSNLYPFFIGISIISVLNLLISHNIGYTARTYYNYQDGINNFGMYIAAFLMLSLWQYQIYRICNNGPAGIFISIFSFVLVSPIVFLPFFNPAYILLDNIFNILVLLGSIYIIIFVSNSKKRKTIVRGIHINDSLFKLILGILLIIGILQLTTYFGDIMSLDWNSMYDRRLIAREVFSDKPVLRYYNSLFGALLIPFCALYGSAYKSFSLVLLSFAGAFASFAAFGGKGVFFSPLLGFLLGIYFVRTTRRNFFLNLAFLFILFCSLCSLEIIFFTNDLHLLNSYAFRRIFYVPAQLTYQYWEYFSNNPVYLMSDSILGSVFGGSPQEYSKSRLIGGIYYGKYIMNANTSIFGTAFGDFGILGMPVIAFIAALIIRYLNRVYEQKNSIIVVAYSVFIALTWTQGALHTSLLSNGILYTLLILLFIPKRAAALK